MNKAEMADLLVARGRMPWKRVPDHDAATPADHATTTGAMQAP